MIEAWDEEDVELAGAFGFSGQLVKDIGRYRTDGACEEEKATLKLSFTGSFTARRDDMASYRIDYKDGIPYRD